MLSSSTRIKAVVRWLAIMLVWQLLFWLVVHSAERAARPTTIDMRANVQYQFVDTNSKPVSPMLTAPRALAMFNVLEKNDAARIRFDLAFEIDNTDTPMALYLSVRNSIDRISVNHQLAQSVSEVPRLQGLVSAEPAFVAIPQEHLQPGLNVISVETPNTGSQWLSEFAIGPAAPLLHAFQWKRFLQTDIALAGVAIIAFTLLLLGVVRWPADDRPRVWSLLALLGTCGASTLLLTFTPPSGFTTVHVAFLFALFSILIAIAIVCYTTIDTKRHLPLKLIAAAVLFAVAAVGAAYLFATTRGPLGEWTRYTVYASFWIVILSALLALLVLAGALLRERGARWFERSMIAFSISAFALDRLSTLWKLHSPFDSSLQITLGWSNIVGAILGLSVVVALAREASEARRVVSSANEVLKSKLAEREAELSESYARESEVQKQTVLMTERQRLLRDMHDGIGGQLVSLQMRLRNQTLAASDIENAVSDSLNDLRLIVHALDDAELDIFDALLHFERRVRDQLKSSGITFDALEVISEGQDRSHVKLGPKITLQLLRILQEGISNAVRHAQASKIMLRTELSQDQLQCVLQDNGVGTEKADATNTRGGHGLMSMQARAAAIGASLELSAAEPGFSSEGLGFRVSVRLRRG
jgi:two-component system, NarL family, sensor histidine kinase UhpB